MSMSADDVTNCTKSEGKYDTELDSDVNMNMRDDVAAPDCVDL
jgi:hypothetical protein